MSYRTFIQPPDWRHLALLVVAALFPVLLALLLSGFVPITPSPLFVEQVVPLETITTLPARELESLFERNSYTWPPQEAVPALAVKHLPRDISTLSIPRKKALFFRTLLPLVLAENERLLAERRWLAGVIKNGGVFDSVQQMRLQKLLTEYGLDSEEKIDSALLKRLYQRIDIIPPGLVLAQAANETGWGTSRFSRMANNLFGEWTYVAAQGIMPLRRHEDASHYVRRFESLRQSVDSYLNNLNRNRAYHRLRALRAWLRKKGHEPDALTLARGLKNYSARGEDYVAEIRAMINGNGLNDLGPLRLARSATAD